MSQGPRSWAASIVGFALVVLAVCWALRVAADNLRAALPVLLPTAVIVASVAVAWRWWINRPHGW